MIDGIILGFMAWLSLALSWWHMPDWVKRWSMRHPVISDGFSGITTWLFLTAVSKSIIAVIGSFVASLLVNFSLLAYEHLWEQDDR